FELYSASKQIKLECKMKNPEKLIVMVHPVYLETVFQNLIDNAIKYSKEGNIVYVSLDYEINEQKLIFAVKSPRGKLINEDLEEIFQFGKRIIKNEIQIVRPKGFGIGLHLTRRICRLYKGDCIAEIKGDSVIFTAIMQLEYSLNRDVLSKGASQKLTDEHLKLHSADFYEENIRRVLINERILLVEDNLMLQEAMKEFLSTYCSVSTASNGEDALKIISDETPSLIISDLLMPEMNGESFYNECSKNPSLAHVPFIFLTGVRDKKIQKKLIANGAIDYLLKPFSNDDLLLKIYSILNLGITVRKKLQSDFYEFLAQPQKSSDSYIVKNKEKSGEEISRSFFIDKGLSEREIEISQVVAKHKTNKEIGEQLFISVSTVATHVQHIYNKCNVKSRTEFISLFLQNTL
ncbi:MAG: response regulator, partial [Treponema sp.]|nr:response regulator [Treponema sp.]